MKAIVLFLVICIIFLGYIVSLRPFIRSPKSVVGKFRLDSLVHSEHSNGSQDSWGEPILVIDIGSTCIKCSAFTNKLPLRLIPDTEVQLCSADVLVDGLAKPSVVCEIVDAVVDAAIKSLRKRGVRHIRGVGFTSFAMNIFGVDGMGEPVTPCYTYASHQLSCNQLEKELKKSFSRDDHIRTGAVIHSSYASVQLKALYAGKHGNDPSELKAVHKWQTLTSHIIAKWTGQVAEAISLSEASWMGLLDFRTGLWDDYTLNEIGVDRETLPRLRDVDEPTLIGLTKDYAEKWPELSSTPLFPAIGDGAAACMGSGCYNPSRISITIGTSCAVRVILPLIRHLPGDETTADAPQWPSIPPEGLFCYRVNKNKVILGGAISDGGALVQWFEGIVGHENIEKARSELDRVFDNQDNDILDEYPLSLPFFSGERGTGYHSAATGTIHGLNRGTSTAGLLYSLMEGVAFRAAEIVGRIVHSGLTDGLPGPYLVTSGKGLRYSGVWRQMIADMTGLPVVVLKHSGETTSLGIARLVLSAFEKDPLVKASIFGSIVYDESKLFGHQYKNKEEELAEGLRVAPSEVVGYSLPRPKMKAFYDERFHKHLSLYKSLLE